MSASKARTLRLRCAALPDSHAFGVRQLLMTSKHVGEVKGREGRRVEASQKILPRTKANDFLSKVIKFKWRLERQSQTGPRPIDCLCVRARARCFPLLFCLPTYKLAHFQERAD